MAGRGDTVIVRAFGGKALKRRVWDVDDGLVYITNDEEFEKLVAGKPAVEPIGFPTEDIFCLSENESTDPTEWSQLVPWRSNVIGRADSGAAKGTAR
jgi:hypothetical protein